MVIVAVCMRQGMYIVSNNLMKAILLGQERLIMRGSVEFSCVD